jgi:hypothetical protein
MSTFRRKGNWNEIAGTLKHQAADPIDKDLKKRQGERTLGTSSEETREGQERTTQTDRKDIMM